MEIVAIYIYILYILYLSSSAWSWSLFLEEEDGGRRNLCTWGCVGGEYRRRWGERELIQGLELALLHFSQNKEAVSMYAQIW